MADQIQYQKFLSGADCPSVNEQIRLDAGPFSTRGDGLFGSTDGAAIDAYARHDQATDFDPNTPGWQPTPAGGPTAITNLGCTPSAAPERAAKVTPERKAASATRVVRVVSRPGARGSDIMVEIEMTAQGNEAGTQYSLHFDPAVLSISDISGVDANPDITRGADAPANNAERQSLTPRMATSVSLRTSAAPWSGCPRRSDPYRGEVPRPDAADRYIEGRFDHSVISGVT